MIDGMTIGIDPAVRNADILDFKPFGNRERAKYKGLIIDHYGHSCYLRGSIHTYSNDGLQNADDFTLSRFIATLQDLCLTLNIHPGSSRFHSIEFGVNVQIPYDVNHFISSIIYLRNGIVTNDNLGVQLQFSEYRVKLYLKTLKGAPEKLRFEVKINRMRRLKDIAKNHVSYCDTLADLASSKLWEVMGKELLSVFDDILIVDVDSIDWKELNDKGRDLWMKGQRPAYWLSKEMSGKQRSRQLERFRAIIAKYAKYNIKEEVRALIDAKITTLIDVETEPVYTHPLHVLCKDKMSDNHQWCKIPIYNEVSENHQQCETVEKNKLSEYHHLDEGGITDTITTDERLCEVTNLSLDIGIKQGTYLSPQGVEYYYNNHRKVFNKVLKPRLSERWINEPLKVQFEEIAHSIRNERFNPNNNLKRAIHKIESNGHLLFPLEELICPTRIDALNLIS